MAAKPSETPRWGNVGGAIVAPTSGKKDIGHVPGEKPTAQHENWLKNLAYQWFEYLDDGVFAGAALFEDGLEVEGGLTVDEIDIGSGVIKHGTRTQVLSPFFGASTSDDTALSITHNGVTFLSAKNASWQVPIILPIGARLLAVRGIIEDQPAGGGFLDTMVQMTVIKSTIPADGSGTSSSLQLGTTEGSDFSSQIQSLVNDGIGAGIVVAARTTFCVSFTKFAIGNDPLDMAECKVYAVEYDYDQP